MTKRVILAVFLLVSAFVLSVFAAFYIEKVCSEMFDAAEDAYSLTGEELYERSAEITGYYDSQKGVLNSFLTRKDADALYLIINGLNIHIAQKDEKGIKNCLYQMMLTVSVIAEGQKPKKENIF